MGRPMLAVTLALVLVVAGCTGSSVELSTTSSTAVSVAPTTASTTTSLAATSTTADPVLAALGETIDLLVDAPELVVAPGLLDGVDLDAGLPDGAVVTPVDGMVLVSGDTAEVLVDVALPDGRTDQFVMVLVNDGERWLVAYTVLVP